MALLRKSQTDFHNSLEISGLDSAEISTFPRADPSLAECRSAVEMALLWRQLLPSTSFLLIKFPVSEDS
jgi:hypothetical protein